ncbi:MULTISPECIES: NirD/YgiW/YdeI family stress tolerance protein [Pantoea]|jgi:uncharacterized protein (TIGR00156 family)|uniref:NirD/YgiW/YdeI family stress tolerance protein n=1 Tax=Pantoea TaxID=53335 RepID=UPI001F3DF8AB|nr:MULTISPECIES: NirD/YgiW/YdeI family stress tolerance protein [Pantoea]UIL54916.1 NirD/YgiW/YdeI family stress tolerance protein [Pantoea agglomerans]
MKKTLLVIFTLIGSSAAFASQQVSVAEAKKMRDDRHVTLTGTITGRADDDHYWLKDSTGRIRIDIDEDDDDDDHYLVGKKVRINGEIDRDDGQTEIDVDRVVIIQ